MIVPCTASVTVTVVAPARHLCPFKPEVDSGEVEISWRTAGATVELHALAELIASRAEREISHEDFTDWLAGELSVLDGIEAVSVISRWATAGASVRVAATPGGGDTP